MRFISCTKMWLIFFYYGTTCQPSQMLSRYNEPWVLICFFEPWNALPLKKWRVITGWIECTFEKPDFKSGSVQDANNGEDLKIRVHWQEMTVIKGTVVGDGEVEFYRKPAWKVRNGDVTCCQGWARERRRPAEFGSILSKWRESEPMPVWRKL